MASTVSATWCPQEEEEEEERELEEEEDKELNIELPARAATGEPPSDSPPWVKALVDKIRAMSVMEKSLVLDTVCKCIQEKNKCVRKEDGSDASTQELLASLNLDLKQPVEKTFLFHFYGLTLRECPSTDLVKKHLAGLLELNHQSSSQRAGIALAMGITAAMHAEVVWAVLEHLGHTRFMRSQSVSSDRHMEEQLDPDRHWKWVSSTSLLCYGQMALHAREQVLPWMDNIISRITYHYSCSSYDSVLRTSFVSAAIMLVKALRCERSVQSYKFTQIPTLIHCLLCILQKEPNVLATFFRQKIILVITGLSSLRPCLKPAVKSRILQTCLKSLFQLPPTEMPRECLLPLESGLDVMVLYQKSMLALNQLLQTFISDNRSMDEVCFLLQHTEPWLKSDKSHERLRVVQSISLLLKCVAGYMKFTEEATPSILGHHIGLLMLLLGDKDEATQTHAHLCVHFLIQLLIQQKGSRAEFKYLNKMKNVEASARKQSEMKIYHLVKALDQYLTVAQHTKLILTLLHGICSHSPLYCDLACHLLLIVFEDCSIRLEQVAEILQGLFHMLPSIILKHTLRTLVKVMTVLGTQHTQETIEVMLSLCHPSERQVAPLWKALATTSRLARKVVTLLYMKLKLRPPQLVVRLSEPAELVSVLALGTIYELLYIREYKAIMLWAFAGLLLGLLTQLHYLFELGEVVEGVTDSQEDILEIKPLSPGRTCLEALKGLFWTTNHWEVFAYVKLLQGWKLFEHLDTFREGVTLLARAMALYSCEVNAVAGQAIISLNSSEERDNVVAILIITEFLNSQELTQYTTRKTLDNFLRLGLNHPNHLVRAMSLTCYGSTVMQPKKVTLIRNLMVGLLDSLLKPEPKDLLGLIEVMGITLHQLGPQGVGAVSLKIAESLLPLFEDDQEDVRGGAIFLYGDVIYSGGKNYQQALKNHAFLSLVPLLIHLADSCPKVVVKTKFTFLRCAILLNWEFRKQLFGKLAWGCGLSAENDIFMCMVESNVSKCHQFLMQAFSYLRSPHKNLKVTAMKFIAGLLQEYFANLCLYLRKGDLKVLRKELEVLRQEQDSVSRKFYQNFLEGLSELSYYVTQ